MIETNILVILAIACVIGGLIHAICGIAFAVPVIPVLAYFVPIHIPATSLFLGLSISTIILLENYKNIRTYDLKYILPARLIGSIPAAFLLWILPSTREVVIMIAILLLVSISMAAFKFNIKQSKQNFIITGLISGVIATLASLGGGPIGILYKDQDRKAVRSTIACIFVIGVLFSLLLIAIIGHLKLSSFYLALQLLPFLIIGYIIGKKVDKYVPASTMKPFVLVFGTLAAVVVIFKAILLY